MRHTIIIMILSLGIILGCTACGKKKSEDINEETRQEKKITEVSDKDLIHSAREEAKMVAIFGLAAERKIPIFDVSVEILCRQMLKNYQEADIKINETLYRKIFMEEFLAIVAECDREVLSYREEKDNPEYAKDIKDVEALAEAMGIDLNDF